MGTLPPTPTLGLVLPDPGTGQPYSRATENGWWTSVDTAFAADRARIGVVEAATKLVVPPSVVVGSGTAGVDANGLITFTNVNNNAVRINQAFMDPEGVYDYVIDVPVVTGTDATSDFYLSLAEAGVVRGALTGRNENHTDTISTGAFALGAQMNIMENFAALNSGFRVHGRVFEAGSNQHRTQLRYEFLGGDGGVTWRQGFIMNTVGQYDRDFRFGLVTGVMTGTVKIRKVF
jgi:hypothetical protein